MAEIHQLSENLTNQIAAGEVIERPASVVKELVENSIDAGASRIRIDIVDSGLKQIIVQDNGSGIAADQLDLAFMRHATSKINTERDLFRVATLGFRGEALASIAAVSHVEILTSTEDSIGVRANFSGGEKISQEEAAAQVGTKITVKDLFFNTPARLKYLRSPRTEMMKIVDIVNRIALGYPQIAITLTNSGKGLMQTAGNNKLKQTVASVYGRQIAEKMINISNQDSDFKISGLVTKPDLTRSTRNYLSILLNGRYIHNLQLNTAIMDGYGSKLTSRHYPVAVINIEVDPFLVDVNVHPSKKEVRLSKEKQLSRLITSAISQALVDHSQENIALDNLVDNRQASLVDQLEFNLNKNVVNTKRIEIPEVSEKIATTSLKENAKTKYVNLNIPIQNDRYIITPSWDDNVKKQTQLAPFGEKKTDEMIISKSDRVIANRLPNLTYIGQNSIYLIAANGEDLYLIDQVAARRRIRFEKISQTFSAEKISQQGLLTAVILEFDNLDFLKIKENFDLFEEIGIFLEDFGQNSFIIRSYPTWLNGDIEKALREIIDQFLNLDHGKKDSFFSRIACQRAKVEIPGRIKLASSEASQIIADLMQVSDPYRDAEGRVTLVKLSQRDLVKMFKKDE